uniref:C2H2-type domain-containing protein n=1 Tax=Lutzomyia longipalpis TaxID=7200 RepID=A0A1B0CGU7_LUTLO
MDFSLTDILTRLRAAGAKAKGHHCPHCSRSFRHKGNLIRHLALHDPESSIHEDAQALKAGRKKRILYDGEFKTEQLDSDEEQEEEEYEDEDMPPDEDMIEETQDSVEEEHKETMIVEGDDDNQYVVLEVIPLGDEEDEGQNSRLNEEFLLSEREVLEGLHDPSKKISVKTENVDKDMGDCFGFDEEEDEEMEVREANPAKKMKKSSIVAKQ